MKRYYNIPFLGKRLLNRIAKREGGEKESITLRKYFKSHHNVEVDLYSYGGCFEPHFNMGGGTVKIGRYCSFGQSVSFFCANHPMNHAVMSPYFYNKGFGGFDVNDVPRSNLLIGNDVWIGYGTIITSSCNSIGNGAVIAAGSIVTKNVPAYAVVAGVPARIIKYRFDDETQDLLEQSEWWSLDPASLMQFYNLIDQPTHWADEVIQYKNRKHVMEG